MDLCSHRLARFQQLLSDPTTVSRTELKRGQEQDRAKNDSTDPVETQVTYDDHDDDDQRRRTREEIRELCIGGKCAVAGPSLARSRGGRSALQSCTTTWLAWLV